MTGKRRIVTGENFYSGAVILVNGVDLATSPDPGSPRTTLISKKGGKKIPTGQPVTLQARSGDGAFTDEFQFTRP